MKLVSRFVDRVRRFSLDVDEESGRCFVSVLVANTVTEYDESYVVDSETFGAFLEDPERAHDFVARAKRRELDALLLLQPGADRGFA